MSTSRGAKAVHRPSTASTREKLLRACRSRLSDRREDLLHRLRREKQTPRALLRSIVREEQLRLARPGQRVEDLPVEEEDGLWRAERSPPADGPEVHMTEEDEDAWGRDGARTELTRAMTEECMGDEEVDVDAIRLSHDDYVELMLRLEEDLNLVLMEQEAAALRQLEWVEALEEADLEHLAELEPRSGHSPRESSELDWEGRRFVDTGMLCPMCESAPVLQRATVLRCSRFGESDESCSFRIDTFGGMGAAHLAEALDAGRLAHIASCASPPVLRVQGSPGAQTLLLECRTCGFLHVVV